MRTRVVINSESVIKKIVHELSWYINKNLKLIKNLWSLAQCLEIDWQDTSVNFLHLFRFKSSIFGHNWKNQIFIMNRSKYLNDMLKAKLKPLTSASVRIEPSAIPSQPLKDNWRKNPPHRLDIFSITGPYEKWKIISRNNPP